VAPPLLSLPAFTVITLAVTRTSFAKRELSGSRFLRWDIAGGFVEWEAIGIEKHCGGTRVLPGT